MNETERQALNEHTAIAGANGTQVEGLGSGGGLRLRAINMENLSVLELIGHPVARAMHAVMRGEKAPQVEMSLVDLNEFLWVLGADEQAVLDTALRCTPDAKLPATKAALEFVRSLGPMTPEMSDALSRAVGTAGLEVKRVQAATFEADVPAELGGSKKN